MSNTLTIERAQATTANGPLAIRPGDPVIEVDGLKVSYGAVEAVRGISFVVKAGEIFGLVGPNGAGKTTTLSAIEGLTKPNRGTVRVLGLDVWPAPDRVQQYIGISLQSTSLFDNLKVRELVRLYAALYEFFPSQTEVAALLERFELSDKAGARAEELSGGQQQRLALALALVNNPQIVILDEPTTGLDPQARRHVWDIIREIRAEGRTVVLTTHYMEEAQELCHRVGIVDRGELIALDTPGALINNLHAGSTITATIRLALDDINALPGVSSAAYEADRLQIHTTDVQETVLGLQRLAVDSRQMLTDLSIKQPDLEDVFITLTGRKMR